MLIIPHFPKMSTKICRFFWIFYIFLTKFVLVHNQSSKKFTLCSNELLTYKTADETEIELGVGDCIRYTLNIKNEIQNIKLMLDYSDNMKLYGVNDADDLSQDTILRALENMDKYIDGTNFKAWVYTIMRNIFINNYRRTTREQTFIDHTENLYSININQVDPNYITENDYDRKEINKTVNKLPQKYKVPLFS